MGRQLPWPLLAVFTFAALCFGLMSIPTTSEGAEEWAQQRAVVSATALMAGMWVTGVVHLGVVALLPVVLYPLLGVASGKDVARQYFSNTVFVLVGSVLLSLALESTAVHKRVALKLLSITPSSPRAFLASFMLVSALLSAVMSNTATCSIACPMAVAVYEELVAVERKARQGELPPAGAAPPGAVPCDLHGESTARAAGVARDLEQGSALPLSEGELADALRPFFGRVLTAVAYSCTIGGISTKTGTGTNLAFAAAYESLVGEGVSCARWLAVGLPVSILLLCFCWAWLSFAFGGTQLPRGYAIPTQSLAETYASMGRASRDQVVVLCAVALTVVLWIGEPAKWAPGLEGTTDATVVMATSLLLFFVPSSEFQGGAILDWKRIAAKIPFDLFLLVGVGGVISSAFVASGLTVRMGNAMAGLSGMPAPLVALIVMGVAAFSSTFMSDVATANILLPIVYALATRLHLDPLVLMLPVTLACSMAFVLPISTPPNAIALASGFVGARDFMKHGGFLVVAGLLVIEGVCFTFGLRAVGAEGV